MGNPLKLLRTGNTSVNIQEMSNTDMDYITHLVLRKVSLESDNSTGALNIAGVGTTIGYFSDTARVESIGTHPTSGTITTTTTTLSQNLVSVSETTISPMELDNKKPRPISSANLDTSVMNYISSNLANTSSPSISQYYLSSTNPVSSYSGTWVSVASLTDTFGGGGGVSSNTTYLWKKTNDSLPTVVRPLKLGVDGTMQEMVDTEIETLTDRYRNRIVSTQVGRYSLATSPPVTGTWIQVGDTFTDTRQQVAANTYAGIYTGSYNTTYTGYFLGTYSSSFAGTYVGAYNRNYTGNYTGTYTSQQIIGYYTGSYGRHTSTSYYSSRTVYNYSYYTGSYTRYGPVGFTGSYAGTYVSPVNKSFTGYYTGSYTSSFAGSYAGTYVSPVNKSFTGNYTGLFTGSYASNFTAAYSGNYTGNYTGDTVSSSRENIITIALWLRIA